MLIGLIVAMDNHRYYLVPVPDLVYHSMYEYKVPVYIHMAGAQAYNDTHARIFRSCVNVV